MLVEGLIHGTPECYMTPGSGAKTHGTRFGPGHSSLLSHLPGYISGGTEKKQGYLSLVTAPSGHILKRLKRALLSRVCFRPSSVQEEWPGSSVSSMATFLYKKDNCFPYFCKYAGRTCCHTAHSGLCRSDEASLTRPVLRSCLHGEFSVGFIM